LTRFKVINDNFGHSAGDYILNQAAARIQDHLNNDFIVSRFAGDKFCISLPNTRAADANLMAIELIEAFQSHFEFLEQTIIIGCPVGISLFPQDGLNADTSLAMLTPALYEAKKVLPVWLFVIKEMASYNKKRHIIEQNLRKILFVNEDLQPQQLFMVYQPFMSLPEKQLAGFEALVRWEHPELGVISPGEFIPITEDTGLIFTLSHWVVNRVCEQLVEWHQQGFDFKRVSVNISALELMNIKFAGDLLQFSGSIWCSTVLV
ncbi:EAL domain-containing protein, partial [Paucibacter sp. O1-1]|nr:EAL domain-containing protein [Paucibacter sp. O1-1]MDA3824424.1 EAL domain-containing protein [Paucibacter sp. O1-1]